MSRRKDREKYVALKAENPEYQGFRGYDSESPSGTSAATVAITCNACGRKRNVTQDVASTEADTYICMSCREEQEESVSQEASEEPVAG